MEPLDLDAVFDRVVETLLHCQQLAAWNASKIRDAQIVIIHKAGGNDVLPWSSLQLQPPMLPLQPRLPLDRLPRGTAPRLSNVTAYATEETLGYHVV